MWLFRAKYKMAQEAANELIAEDKLVEQWAEFPCLYDVSSTDFKNRDKRQNALEQLANSVEQNVEWVKSKLRLLRNSYTKATKPLSSGSARKNVSKRTQWLVDKLQFLAPYCASRTTISNLDLSSISSTSTASETECVRIENDTQAITCNTDTEESSELSTKQPIKSRAKSSKRKREDEENELIKGLLSSISRKENVSQNTVTEDEVDKFGQYMIASLRKLDPPVRNMVQHRIQNVLYEAQIGSYNHFPHQMSSQLSQHYPLTPQNPYVPGSYSAQLFCPNSSTDQTETFTSL